MTTKTVQGYFGPKQVTREQYVKQWTDHFGEVYHLTSTTAEYDELTAMKARIADLAGQKWDGLPLNH
jgi:hypothetical protein